MGLRDRQERASFLRGYRAALDEASTRGLVVSLDTLGAAHRAALASVTASSAAQYRQLTEDEAAQLEWMCLGHLARTFALTHLEAAQRCVVDPWHRAFDERMHAHMDRLDAWSGPDVYAKRAIAFARSQDEACDAVPGARGREVTRHFRAAMLTAATKRWCPVTDPTINDLNVFYFAAVDHAQHATATSAGRTERSGSLLTNR